MFDVDNLPEPTFGNWVYQRQSDGTTENARPSYRWVETGKRELWNADDTSVV